MNVLSCVSRWLHPVVPNCATLIKGLVVVAGLALLTGLGGNPALATSHPPCPDADGDGYHACSMSCDATGLLCGDCNDGSFSVNPGRPEVCNDGINNDCNAATPDVFDGDGDGFDCVVDCNDGNPAVNPGARELCGNDIDDDCRFGPDGLIQDVCSFNDPMGCSLGDPGGCCVAGGIPICEGGDEVCRICDLEPGTDPADGIVDLDTCRRPLASELPDHDPEIAGAPNCFDGDDNDCDGLVDHEQASCQTAELCNGFDDDNNGLVDDGFSLGGSCSAGVGACRRNGIFVCSADGLSSECSAIPGSPATENTPGSGRCVDGIDNDCDGLLDLADPGCQSGEICDGLDNDGDGSVDEDFTDLGDPCTVGTGACERPGTRICSNDRTTTVCGAAPGLATTEGPAGPTCSDGIDNDCDGTADAADPGCGSAGLSVTCALDRGQPGNDCGGWHRIFIETSGHAPDAEIVAEALALDESGRIVQSIPVQSHQLIHMTSRAGRIRVSTDGTVHKMVAPIPMLRVTVDDGLNRGVAFCSPIPYLDVVQPANTVVTTAVGDVTDVVAAIPLVDPASLFVKVDGVDILSGLGIDPATDFPGGPYNGVVSVNGQPVEVSDLRVDTNRREVQSSNTLTMKLSNMGCGGHIVVVDGERRPGEIEDPTKSKCVLDDVRDKGTSMVFDISIDSPEEGEITSAVPTPVSGVACHGREIASVRINGKPVDTSGLMFTPGDGEDSADSYTLPINTSLGQTDLARDYASGDEPLGTFDPGSNRLIAEATDDLGNRTFDSLIFAVGTVQKPDALSATAFQTTLSEAPHQVTEMLQGLANRFIRDPLASTTVELDNAFVVGITEPAVQKVFDAKCVGAAQEFVAAVRSEIPIGTLVDTRKVSGGCSCDPTVRTRIAAININPNAISCPINFVNGKIEVAIKLPPINLTLRSSGSCRTEGRICVPFTDACVSVCLAETIVNDTFNMTYTPFGVDFDITEGQLEGTEAPGQPTRGRCELNPAVACFDNSDCPGLGDCLVADFSISGSVGAEVNCLASVCNWFLNGLILIANVIPGVHIDPVLVDFTIDVDFNREIGASEPDPIELAEIEVKEEEIEPFGQTLAGKISEVSITPTGLTAGLKGTFMTLEVDPEIPDSPGAVTSVAPLPPTPVAGGGEIYLGLADDTFNMMFASLVSSGKLKTGCEATGKTLGDLIPADCESITGANDAVAASARGFCHGLREADCEALAGPSLFLTPISQGLCHGAEGATCDAVPAGLDGVVQPSDCDSITIPADDVPPELAGLIDVANAILQGRCWGLQGADCETLTASSNPLIARKQGACHGMQPALNPGCTSDGPTLLTTATERGTCQGMREVTCSSIPSGQQLACTTTQAILTFVDDLLVSLEQGACGGVPPLNFNASQNLLFCTQQDLPPRLQLRDQPASGVQTVLRLNDLSVAILVDRNADGPDGAFLATPNCFATGAPAVGDCNLFGLCLDLNFDTTLDFQTCTNGEPGLITTVDDIRLTIREQGVVCSGSIAADDGLLTDEAAEDNTIDLLMDNIDMFTPPVCAAGLTLGNPDFGIAMPRLIVIETDMDTEFQDYLGITGNIDTSP